MTVTIEEIISEACDLPAVPDVTQKVMHIMADPNANSSMLCKAISVDQAMTARILKISNSAFYGCLRTINNLQSAIVIIGFSAIRSLVIAVSTKEVYKSFGLTERMLWEHSVGVGIASHILAREAKVSKVDDVFVCGLMHDIGKVIMNNSNKELFSTVMEKIYNDKDIPLDAEQDVFGFTHPEVGAMVIKKWNLTEELEMAIRYHHDIEALADQDQYINMLASIIHLADLFCKKLAIGCKEADESIELKGTYAAKNIGITDDRIDDLLVQIEKTYYDEKNLF